MSRLALLAVLAAGCGSGTASRPYTVTTLTVTARRPASEVTLIVDRSAAIAPLLPELQGAVATALERQPSAYRWNLMALPADDACGAGPVLLGPLVSAEDEPEQLAARTYQVVDAVKALTAAGSASITATLASLLDSEEERVRERFILLLTASEPACPGDALQVVQLHRRQERRTIVVTFGPDFTPSPLLESMARAGGVLPTCLDGCFGGDVCGADGLCRRATWHAADGAELEALLTSMLRVQTASSVCSYSLSGTPSGPDAVRVYVDHRLLEPVTDYTLTGAQIELIGDTCTRVERSTAQKPVEVQLWVDLTP